MGKVVGEFYATPSEMYWRGIELGDMIEEKINIVSRQKQIATISADVMGPVKDLINIEIESTPQNEINLIASLKTQPCLQDNVKVSGFIQVVIVDQLQEKHRLNIPIDALIQSD